jgi:hypothetical protein
MALAVVVDVDTFDRVTVRARYDEQLVQALKSIPSPCRSYDPATKVWAIDPDWSDVILQLLAGLGAIVTDRRPASPSALPVRQVAPALQAACDALCITPDASIAVAEAAFKALARVHHPDVGGSTERMQHLVEALATFKAFTDGGPACRF